METVKGVIFTACGAGIISCLAELAAAGTGGKRLMRTIVGMALIITLIRPLTGGELEDTVRQLTETELSSSQQELTGSVTDYYLRAAELSVKTEIEKQLSSEGIEFSSLVISCDIDEYDVISVRSAEITVKDRSNIDKVSAFIASLLPEAAVSARSEEQNESE